MKLQNLQLNWPTAVHTIAQHFGDNANPLYAGQGLKGHPGTDIAAQWSDPISDVTGGLGNVYKVFHKDDPILMDYRAVCQLLELEDCVVEITYGHVNDILFVEGIPTSGQQLATVGNTGEVYQGSHEVTEAEKQAGSHAGAHLHFQGRICQKVSGEIDPKLQYLADVKGMPYRDINGMVYLIPDYNNGYNGCIDLLPYLQVQSKSNLKQQLVDDELSLVDILNVYIQYLRGKIAGKNTNTL